MMNTFNEYLLNIDYSALKELFLLQGERQIYGKKSFFVRQNSFSGWAGWVESGTFRYTYLSEEGNEHSVGYAFADEFVGDYASFIKRSFALVNIQAVTPCTVYQLPRQEIIDYLDTDINTLRLGKHIADRLYEEIYKRLLASYGDSAEKRYIQLMQRCPEIKEVIPLKEIASFLGVTPETVSHIRKKLSLRGKS